MRKIGEWALLESVDGRRAMKTSGPGGERVLVTMAADGLAVQEIRCPDAVFDAMQQGVTLTDQQLLSLEFVHVSGVPKQVLKELCADGATV